MMRALAGCDGCGYATRRHSHVGRSGKCPDCSGALRDLSLGELHAFVQVKRPASQARDRAAAPATG